MIDAMNGCEWLRIRDEEGEEGLGTFYRSPKALQKLVLHVGAQRSDPGPLVHDHFSDAGPTGSRNLGTVEPPTIRQCLRTPEITSYPGRRRENVYV